MVKSPAAGLDPFTAYVVRSTVQQTTQRAARLTALSAQLREQLEQGETELAGQTAGDMFRWTMLLLAGGASLQDVRALIAAGAAQTDERVA